MKLRGVSLEAPAGRFGELARFYRAILGLSGLTGESSAAYRVGWTELTFAAYQGVGTPFYHFALLVPGNRFTAALQWARNRVELLEMADTGEEVVHFENWGANACYFHDPVGNIIELIAHAGVHDSGRRAGFLPRELLGICEIGLVGATERSAVAAGALGLSIFQGKLQELAFVGERTAAIILSPEGRGWLPQHRAAEPWPAAVRVDEVPGMPPSSTALDAGMHRIEVTGVDALPVLSGSPA